MRTILLFLLLTLPLAAQEPQTLKLTPSPKTTYLTEPVLPDGRIDYAAALNQQLADQTTPENNLLVGVFALVPGETEAGIIRNPNTSESNKKFREKFWKMLGLDAPPLLDTLVSIAPTDCVATASMEDFQKGLREFFSQEELSVWIERGRERDRKYYRVRFNEGKMSKEAYEQAIKRVETSEWYYTDIVEDQWMQAMKRPWTAKEFPYLAHWITTTDDLTQKLIALSKERTGYYHPWLTYDDDFTMIQEGLLPYAQSLRNVARLFEVRGNLAFTQGDLDQAFECALASIRMGQTMKRGAGCIVEDLVGHAMTGMGNAQLTTYLAELSKETKSTWILQKKKEFDALKMEIDFRISQPHWCVSDRLATLSFIQTVIVNPKRAADGLWWDNDEEKATGLAHYEKLFQSGTEYDWNEMMRQVNLFYDDWEDIYYLPDWQRRFQAMKRFVKRAVEAGERSVDSNDSPEQRAAGFIVSNFIPVLENSLYAMARNEWDHRATSLGFALAAYRADNDGNYPDTLEQLVPKYMDAIPDSPHTGKPMRYIKRQNDVLIANDDAYKLDGSEEEIEKMITDAKSGGRVAPTMEHLIFVVEKD